VWAIEEDICIITWLGAFCLYPVVTGLFLGEVGAENLFYRFFLRVKLCLIIFLFKGNSPWLWPPLFLRVALDPKLYWYVVISIAFL
jgi:hypothetical protein